MRCHKGSRSAAGDVLPRALLRSTRESVSAASNCALAVVLVLASALIHAGANALVKIGADALLTMKLGL